MLKLSISVCFWWGKIDVNLTWINLFSIFSWQIFWEICSRSAATRLARFFRQGCWNVAEARTAAQAVAAGPHCAAFVESLMVLSSPPAEERCGQPTVLTVFLSQMLCGEKGRWPALCSSLCAGLLLRLWRCPQSRLGQTWKELSVIRPLHGLPQSWGWWCTHFRCYGQCKDAACSRPR